MLNYLRDLHMSTSEDEWKLRYTAFKKAFAKEPEFLQYFEDYWVKGDFGYWVIYARLSGIAATNNPLESFNREVKEFTNRERGSLSALIESLMEMIHHYSTDGRKEIARTREYPKELINKAKRQAAQYVVAVLNKRDDRYIIKHSKKAEKKYELITALPPAVGWICSCPYGMKWGICKHVPMLLKSLNVRCAGVPDIRGFVAVRQKRAMEKSAEKPLTKAGRRKKARLALVADV
jgi:hypothetical protein